MGVEQADAPTLTFPDMPHDVSLIALIAAGFGLALVLGLIASRLHVPPLVGYLLAGIAIGPGTPGFVGDLALAGQLAEIGVMLLMFGVGLHFSLGDLMAVRKIAVPGAVVQIAAATALGAGTALWWGWPMGEAVLFGLALSVASTVVLLRALEAKGLLDSTNGRIAVGWLVVDPAVCVRQDCPARCVAPGRPESSPPVCFAPWYRAAIRVVPGPAVARAAHRLMRCARSPVRQGHRRHPSARQS